MAELQAQEKNARGYTLSFKGVLARQAYEGKAKRFA
jgi:hypothetical protein